MGAGPAVRCPTSRQPARRGKSLWAEEALSKQRNAARSPGDAGGEEGGGGAVEAAWLPASLPASPGNYPHPQPRLQLRGRGRRAVHDSCFHFTFVDPGGKRERPRSCTAPSPEPRVRSVPAAGLGTEPAECPKRSRALGTCPAAPRRASRASRGCLSLSLPRPLRARRPETGGAGELEMPVAAPPRSAPDPGFCRSGGASTGQWI